MIVDAQEADGPLIEEIAQGSGAFGDEELDALGAVWEEFVLLGPEDSGYDFLVDRVDDAVLGFVCSGPRDLTDGVCELYYLVVDPAARRQGVGRRLLRACEAEAREFGARMVIAETISAPRYGCSQELCLEMGYQVEASVKDFYAVGEDLAMLVKRF